MSDELMPYEKAGRVIRFLAWLQLAAFVPLLSAGARAASYPDTAPAEAVFRHASVPPGAEAAVTADCPDGKRVSRGGVDSETSSAVKVISSRASAGRDGISGWSVRVRNTDRETARQVSVTAYCVDQPPALPVLSPAPLAETDAADVPVAAGFTAILSHRTQAELRADYWPAKNKLIEKTHAFPDKRWGILAFGGEVKTEFEDAHIPMRVLKVSGGEPSGEVFRGAWDKFGKDALFNRFLPVEAGRYRVVFAKPGFAAAGFEIDVPEGEIAEIDQSVLLLRPGQSLPGTPLLTTAPRLDAPDDRAVFDTYPRSTVLMWSPVPGARRYGVEVQYCFPGECTDKNAGVFARQTDLEGPAYTTGFIGAQWGRWRAWAIGDDNRPGPKSEWRTFLFRK